jgi:membrane-associated phospholipid phosphatase
VLRSLPSGGSRFRGALVALALAASRPVSAEAPPSFMPLGFVSGFTLGGVVGATGTGASPAPRMQGFGAADIAVTAGAVGIAVVSRFVLQPPPAEECRWCDTKDGQDTLNGLDRRVADALRWQDRNRANRWSNVTLTATLGQSVGFLAFGNQPAALRDGAYVLESIAVTSALAQVTKRIARRSRPYAHRDDPPPGVDLANADARESFFSGHASSAFAMAVSTGTIALARREAHAGLVLGTGLALAATTSYLRMAADRHYFTDVLVGAAVGSAVGFLVPHLNRPADAAQNTGTTPTTQVGGGIGVSVPLVLRVKGSLVGGAVSAAYGGGGPALTVRLVW